MTEHSSLGPFVTGTVNGYEVGEVTADDRIRMAKGFTREQCEQALAMPHLQTTVRKAVERRLQKLAKGETPA